MAASCPLRRGGGQHDSGISCCFSTGNARTSSRIACSRDIGKPQLKCEPAKSKTPVATCRCYSISSPNAFMFLVSTVLGYFPEPHKLKEPKSLYQSPSGATGPDPTHSRSEEHTSELQSLRH